MNIAVLGSGGREHSIGLKLSESPLVESLYFLPGNPGTLEIGKNENIELSDFVAVADFCKKKSIDYVVVGPEDPLVEGIVDYLYENKIKVFGPSKAAAKLEGSKAFSKDFMKKYKIPTASYENFSDYEQAVNYLENHSLPVVIKASGLAAGKGAIICETKDSALQALKELMQDKIFGDAGQEVVIEEFLIGEEASIFAISDGKYFKILPTAQDHKQAYDGDKGPNTGGMGTYAPAPVVTEKVMDQTISNILEPLFKGMNMEGTPYKGVLFVGLMITDSGPKVIEFNCRFGDPETQVVLPLYSGDLAKLFNDAINERFSFNSELAKHNNFAVCLIQASGGYPGNYEKGKEIIGLDSLPTNTVLIHAGTKLEKGRLKTNGGRVLGLVSQSQTLEDAIKNVYKANNIISFEAKHYRTDIGQKGLKHF